MSKPGYVSNLVDHLADILPRSYPWLDRLATAGLISDLGSALPITINSPTDGDYVIVWDGAAADGATVALVGGTGTVHETIDDAAADAGIGPCWALVTAAVGATSLTVTAGGTPPATARVYHVPASAGRIIKVDQEQFENAPLLLIAQPSVGWSSEAQNIRTVRAVVDVWLMVTETGTDAGEDLQLAADTASRMIEHLWEQADVLDVLDWELVDVEVDHAFRGNPITQNDNEIIVPITLGLEAR